MPIFDNEFLGTGVGDHVGSRWDFRVASAAQRL
jgi:hypothetical protein